jgi:uncharacterized integral membrane protein (TIGR00698 family)
MITTPIGADALATHAQFASLEAMEGLASPETAPSRISRLDRLRALYPGLLAAGVIGLAATWLSQHYGAPVMLFALLLGMAFHFLHEEGSCVQGIEFASRQVLRLGVALLGARITAAQILDLGVMPIATVVVGVATTIGFGVLISRRLGLSRSFGVLSGGAVGICGASAALAVASVLPRDRDSERDTILAVVTVTALSTIAMITYPMIAAAFHLDHVRAGIFLGGTIHDVAQVVGAGYTISPQTGDIATYVKLLRVTLLLPVVFSIAFLVRRGAKGGKGAAKAPMPWFLFGFAALVAANSFGMIAKPVGAGANDLSRALLVTAIAALGMKTSFGELVKVGWRPVALMVLETAWVGALVLAAVLFWK